MEPQMYVWEVGFSKIDGDGDDDKNCEQFGEDGLKILIRKADEMTESKKSKFVVAPDFMGAYRQAGLLDGYVLSFISRRAKIGSFDI